MSISHLPQYMLGGFPTRLSCADIVKEIIFHILAIIYAAICTFMYTCAQIFPHFLKNCLMLYDQRERVREREKILRCFGNWESRERTLSRLALKRNRASQWLSEWGRDGGGVSVDNIDLNTCKHIWLSVIQLLCWWWKRRRGSGPKKAESRATLLLNGLYGRK